MRVCVCRVHVCVIVWFCFYWHTKLFTHLVQTRGVYVTVAVMIELLPEARCVCVRCHVTIRAEPPHAARQVEHRVSDAQIT